MPAGRPSKLTPQKIKEALEYIEHGYKEREDMIPSAAGMACALNVNKSTLYRWADEQPGKFRDILAKCNEKQERILVSKGLDGTFNSNICKLVLGKHGYHDKQDHHGPEGKELRINIVRHGDD